MIEGQNCFKEIEDITKLLKKLKEKCYKKVDLEKIKNITIDEKLKAQNQFTSFYQEVTRTENYLDNFLMVVF